MKNQQGFTLFELIAVLILIGVIASFVAFFLLTGFKGYLKTKSATEGALNAQMALDRIALELRDISDIIPTPSSTSVTYKSEKLTGTRTLKYVGDRIIIRVDPNDYPLLEGVTSFLLQYEDQDLDPNTLEREVAGIDVEFFLNGIGKKFETEILPRNLVKKTW